MEACGTALARQSLAQKIHLLGALGSRGENLPYCFGQPDDDSVPGAFEGSFAGIRAAEAAHQASLYGAAVDDVRLLRRRGYVVTREQDKVLVGNALCTFEQMRSWAARERRLMAAAIMD